MNDTSPMLSRSGTSSPMGKCSEPVKVWLPIEIEAELKQLAASDGATASELMRDMVFMRLRGKTYGEFCAEHRRALLLGEGALAALIPLELRGEVQADGRKLQAVA